MKYLSLALLPAVVIPGIAGFLLARAMARHHGVTVVTEKDSWIESNPADAIAELFTRPVRRQSSIRFYLPVQNDQEAGILARGTVPHEIRIDGRPVEELSSRFWAITQTPLPGGLREIEILLPKGMRHSAKALEITWTRDYVNSQPLAHGDIFHRPITRSQLLMDRASGALKTFARFNVVFFPLLFAVLWFLRRKTIAPLSRNDWILLLLIGLILFVRLNGIFYHVHDGLHPDEKVAENAAFKIRQGNFRPQFFFYSQGFMYLTALVEKAGFWITDSTWQRHVGSRLVSGIFSGLSCLVLFSISRILLDRATAFLSIMLFGLSFMPVILGHYGIIEPTMVFFFLLAFRQILKIEPEKTRSFVTAGLLAGSAVGVKQTAGVIFIPLLCFYFYHFRGRLFSRDALVKFASWGAAAAILYFAISPYNLIAFPKFVTTQLWQIRSLSGEEATNIFFRSSQPGVLLIGQYLRDGLGYPFLIVSMIGMVMIWKRSLFASILILPITLAYFAVCSIVRTPPYHYPLLLCPFLAILAAVALRAIQPSFARFAPFALAVLILIPSLTKVVRLQNIVRFEDTREQAVEWAYRNLPPRTKVDTEFFGPRFWMPIFRTYQIPLRRIDEWETYLAKRQPEYYITDWTTSHVFVDPRHYPLETHWYESLKREGEVVKRFSADSLALYNPEIVIYRLNPQRRD